MNCSKVEGLTCWMGEAYTVEECQKCSYQKGVKVNTLEQAKKDHPDAVCFYKSDCPKLEPALFPSGPCSGSAKRWPTMFCGARNSLDRTNSAEIDRAVALTGVKEATIDKETIEGGESK